MWVANSWALVLLRASVRWHDLGVGQEALARNSSNASTGMCAIPSAIT
jgi:hypothetical protein